MDNPIEMEDGGGGVDDPVQQLRVRNFVAARATEIASLTAQIGRSENGSSLRKGKGLAFQHVSKHMRRRAVSHNPKRLPLRLRFTHLCQIKKSAGKLVAKRKRPRRKFHKRKEANLLEYNRRQLQNPMWLETHMWHAKRFHMKSMWGRRLPVAPTAKCFRSLFRAAIRTAVMQDMSYLSTLEMSGQRDLLVKGLTQLFKPSCNEIQVDSATAFSCLYELLGNVYSVDGSYIGCVKYLWIPTAATEDEHRILFWVHPADKLDIIKVLVDVFDLLEISQSHSLPLPESPNLDEQKVLWKRLRNLSYRSQTTNIRLKDCSENYCRIKITGPKTLPILSDILKVGSYPGASDGSCKAKQEQVWNSMETLASIPNNQVIPLNVVDPRLELPVNRKPVVVKKQTCCTVHLPEELSDVSSLLWDEKVRSEVLRNKTSDLLLSKNRSANLIPGTKVTDLTPNVIPVVLVVRSGSSCGTENPVFSGIDLILPSGWMMAFWVSLSYRCVRAYGMEFNDYLAFDEDAFEGFHGSRYHSPDSSAYYSEKISAESSAKSNYFARPPPQRHNLVKLGCAFPFSVDWERFLNFSCELESATVTVLRNRNDTLTLLNFLNKKSCDNCDIDETHLVRVKVVLLSGAVSERSALCKPTSSDLQIFESKRYRKEQILEEAKVDHLQVTRAELTRKHRKRLSMLSKKRKAARRAASNVTSRNQTQRFDLEARLKELDSKEEVANFNARLNSLWMDEDTEHELSVQSRSVIGVATYAHFSYLKGRSVAVGFIPVRHLKTLSLEQNGKRKPLVLVRDWSKTLTYHWAELQVCSMYSKSVASTRLAKPPVEKTVKVGDAVITYQS